MRYWRLTGRSITLAHPRGKDYTEILLTRLSDPETREQEVRRLLAKSWVPVDAIKELLVIARRKLCTA